MCYVSYDFEVLAAVVNGYFLVPPTKAELLGYKSDSELIVREEEEVELVCRIHNARPRPDIIWYLGDQEFIKGICSQCHL